VSAHETAESGRGREGSQLPLICEGREGKLVSETNRLYTPRP